MKLISTYYKFSTNTFSKHMYCYTTELTNYKMHRGISQLKSVSILCKINDDINISVYD